MNSVIYNGGHQLPEELIIQVLTNLGCSDIKNNHYNIPYNGMNVDGLKPDFICRFDGHNAAIEVGELAQYYNRNKIQVFLDKFDYVIHLFQDKKILLLHCIVYSKKQVISEDIIKTLRSQQQYCDNLLKEFS